MASHLRKGIALGDASLLADVTLHSYHNQQRHFLETQTKWVRFWADWPALQAEGEPIGNNPKWAVLDSQIKKAIGDGLMVIVTAFRYPTWTNRNRTAGGVPTGDDPLQYVSDHLGMYIPGTNTRTPWSLFIEHLTIRYNPANPGNGGAFAHCIELMNEPNLQMRPQSNIHELVYDMMHTGQQVKALNGILDYWPILLAPATADTTETKVGERTKYDTFVSNLAGKLATTKFKAGAWFGWSHHNHRDIEEDAGADGPKPNKARDTRQRIKGVWYGWGSPNDPNNPWIFLTEGGGRLNRINEEWFQRSGTPSQLRSKQAELLRKNHARMLKGGPGEDGEGIAMLMQYLATSSWKYDTGLRDADLYPSEATFS